MAGVIVPGTGCPLATTGAATTEGPVPPGYSLRLRGWLERMGEQSALFSLQTCNSEEVVCEATVTLAAVQRGSSRHVSCTTIEALQREHQPMGMAR
ncbi:MAG: hypothetical protein C0437_00120 [Ralstonia sp.]|jgi:acyl-CoA thioesterase FadM|nr:hypothetical protein [Ralstonia sp.]